MTLAQMHCHLNNEPEPYSKAMTFMASEGMLHLFNTAKLCFVLKH